MKLIAVYVVFVLIGEAVAYFVGRTVEHWSMTASLPVFLACFFLCFLGRMAAGDPRRLNFLVPGSHGIFRNRCNG